MSESKEREKTVSESEKNPSGSRASGNFGEEKKSREDSPPTDSSQPNQQSKTGASDSVGTSGGLEGGGAVEGGESSDSVGTSGGLEGGEAVEGGESSDSAGTSDRFVSSNWMEDVEPWGVESPVIPPQWRPVLPLVMLVILLGVGYSFLDEFVYTLMPRRAIDLGVVSDGCDSDFYGKIRHNSFVKLRGAIPQPGLTVKARVKFKERYYVVVLGCDLIISVTPERYQQLFAGFYQKVIVLDKNGGPLKGSESQAEVRRKGRDIPLHKERLMAGPPWIEGRALKFFSTSALDNIRHFYSHYLGVEFSDSSYLIRDGEYPGQNWWLLLLFVGLLILVIYNLFSFWRATREYLEFRKSLK